MLVARDDGVPFSSQVALGGQLRAQLPRVALQVVERGRRRAAPGGGASSRTGRLSRAYFASASLWTLEAERALGAAAAGAPRLATVAEPTRLASFWHVHLLRALRCSGSVTHA